MSEFRELKSLLIDEWDFAATPSAKPSVESLQQAIGRTRPRRGGLVIGDGIDPASGRGRLELIVHARGGPDHARAERLVSHAKMQGIDAILHVFRSRPSIRQPNGGAKSEPKLGGRRAGLHLGASVAHERGFAGSLGAFVTIRHDDSAPTSGILSCSHVLAQAGRFHVREDDPIQHPGSPEAIEAIFRIGELSQYFEVFDRLREDNLDAAVARLSARSLSSALGNVIPREPCIPPEFQGRAIGAPLSEDETAPGLPVIKIGRTTCFTRGRISLVDVQNFRPNLQQGAVYTFGSVCQVTPTPPYVTFTDAGDSGSLVMTEEGLHPVGIHFCWAALEGGASVSYFVPIWRILEVYPISFI